MKRRSKVNAEDSSSGWRENSSDFEIAAQSMIIARGIRKSRCWIRKFNTMGFKGFRKISNKKGVFITPLF